LAALVFVVVYVGMFLGELPRLQLDRTGIALLGALALVATRTVTLDQAADYVDVPTLGLLFGLMVVSAQLRLGGFYGEVARRLETLGVGPAALLGVLVGVVGLLAAIFTNDVVCLAVTPVVLEGCRRRGLDPVPYLLGVACASNVGSAATLIGNPQNILIGQVLRVGFTDYLRLALLPSLLALAATWLVLERAYQGRWHAPGGEDPERRSERRPFDRYHAAKGLTVAAALLVLFIVSDWPREVLALAGAGLLLTSRRLHSREMLGLVDWQLLVLFAGLFVVNGAVQDAGHAARGLALLQASGVDLREPGWLFGASVVLSNLVSNVPAVMLLLPAADGAGDAAALALSSTLAGNLLIVGSIANIIVVDAAARHGVAIDWRTHARVGIPVTLATLAIAAAAIAVAG
jgi:Na+/H+ antiporter NhaD/arsenite permease-like protein